MSNVNSLDYLINQQYRRPNNLSARILLHQRYGTGAGNWYDFVLKQLCLKPEERLFAMGEGNGMQWRSGFAPGAQRNELFLSDLSLGMISEAALELNECSGVLCLCCDAQSAPFEAGQFDAVTAHHMLYHVPDPDKAIAEAVRLLKPTGRFLAATNGVGHMDGLSKLLIAFAPEDESRYRYSDSFTLEDGLVRLRRHFKVVERVDYLDDLWVTDASDLANYVFSMSATDGAISEIRRNELAAFFQSMIDKEGGIFIAKSTGILIGREPIS